MDHYQKMDNAKHNHSNCTVCRDLPEQMGVIPPAVPSDWIPDATMLRRMYLKGQDANGNVFPPPLHSEYCQEM